MEKATSDGRTLAVERKRSASSGKEDVDRAPPRNTLDLFNRDNSSVTALFWDGRVHAILNSGNVRFESIQGHFTHDRMQNLLAVQALSPLTTQHEMLGVSGVPSSANLASEHANQRNELAIGPLIVHPHSTMRIAEKLMIRILGTEGAEPSRMQKAYRQLFSAAYPNREVAEITIDDLCNALAHFQELAFATRNTRWDEYLAGDANAISSFEKRGAIVFFGRGRCAVCHSGPLLSDFSFHSLGIRSAMRDASNGESIDIGRFAVTKNASDMHHFRTPPLRNVTLTAPYFHDGSAHDIFAAIKQHVRPLAMAGQYDESGAHAMPRSLIDSVSPILLLETPLTGAEIELLAAFLATLEDSEAMDLSKLRPRNVPSGLDMSSSQGSLASE
jgi:cytochrome c peroxidase